VLLCARVWNGAEIQKANRNIEPYCTLDMGQHHQSCGIAFDLEAVALLSPGVGMCMRNVGRRCIDDRLQEVHIRVVWVCALTRKAWTSTAASTEQVTRTASSR
jgi:hypothetical protein